MKKLIEPILLGIALAYLVFGFSILAACISVAHGAELSLVDYPISPAPLCVNVQCIEVR